jgi:hypothetical protein
MLMSVFKFLFWVLTTIIVAYFMTDIKVGGKTLKEHIDDLLASPAGVHLKTEAGQWVESKVGSFSGDLPNKVESPPTQAPLPKEEITSQDETALQKLLKKNQ